MVIKLIAHASILRGGLTDTLANYTLRSVKVYVNVGIKQKKFYEQLTNYRSEIVLLFMTMGNQNDWSQTAMNH